MKKQDVPSELSTRLAANAVLVMLSLAKHPVNDPVLWVYSYRTGFCTRCFAGLSMTSTYFGAGGRLCLPQPF